jgi:hypothetical protein
MLGDGMRVGVTTNLRKVSGGMGGLKAGGRRREEGGRRGAQKVEEENII